MDIKKKIGKRETLIIKRIAEGDTNNEIAKNLKLSLSNTNAILNKLFFWTDTKGRAHLVAWAFKNGIL